MAHLVDTSILGRLANSADAPHGVATRAILELHRRGEVPHITSQILIEFRSVDPAWKAMVESLGVIGKQVHDARLVAVCHVHGVMHLLTFNTAHFARFASYGPGLIVVDPHDV